MADTATMLGKELYVIFTRPVGPPEEIRKMLPQHLDRQVELEKAGIMFGAGPMFRDGEDHPAFGMIIVRANSFEEADAIAAEDPFHKAGLREYEIHKWVMNEGSFTVTINYSDQTAQVV
jgi:uncharacterized protein YciI